ncbi:hypothetical protein Pla175_16580 [Pirellulimonas nuda]|uniref:DUF2383 domain-containing protein n=1 Tax=Pirellulimonas nuda TaxID=2528009 RepID=A0A518D9X8_9BACT|nr:PA2169 family four-helix-bundle protein [Pirellulimonas nuda]QDU88284.1 hypothetical protein Pla175_16580 [Pirellulimonas nuda]
MSILTSENVANLADETVSKLVDLTRANLDSSKGFSDAAKTLDNQRLKKVFEEQSRIRSANAAELQSLVSINDNDPPEEGSWLAAMHRSWLAVRTALSSNDDQAVLEEAERGEDYIKKMYEDVLKETAGSAVNDILQAQYAGVKKTHDAVRDLRDAMKS